jgi:hypothetical protein
MRTSVEGILGPTDIDLAGVGFRRPNNKIILQLLSKNIAESAYRKRDETLSNIHFRKR